MYPVVAILQQAETQSLGPSNFTLFGEDAVAEGGFWAQDGRWGQKHSGSFVSPRVQAPTRAVSPDWPGHLGPLFHIQIPACVESVSVFSSILFGKLL